MEKIIIFGGSGFLGSWIVKAFLKKGYSVSIFDLKIQKELLSHVVGNDINKIKFINGDIRDLTNCEIACDGVDFVLHHAALGSVPRSIEDPINTNKTNIDGFLNMLMASRNANVKRSASCDAEPIS